MTDQKPDGWGEHYERMKAENERLKRELTQMLTDFIQSRERKAFNRARAATMQEKHEGITGHLVDGLKFVHDDFEHYQASEEYEE